MPGSQQILPRDRGFTLLELLLVTVILATLVGICLPRFRNSFDALQHKNYILNLSSLLRFAHDKAIVEKELYRVRYTENPSGYKLEKASGARVADRTGQFHPLPQGLSARVEPTEILLFPDGGTSDAHWVFKNSNGQEIGLRVSADSADILVEESNA